MAMLKMFKISALGLVTFTAVSLALVGVDVRAAVAGDSDAQIVPSASTGGGVGGQYFQVDWGTEPASNGRSAIVGYVYNNYGEPARNVELRISMLDTSGNVVSSVTRSVAGTVPAGDRAYFKVNVPNSPSRYDVTVASFDFVELPGAH
jgi:hypothetical protein